MKFDFRKLAPLERYKLLLATVLPRPIAWITTRDASGAVNLAPFSFFNVFGSDPATVGIGIGSKRPGEPKDTRQYPHERAVRRQSRAVRACGADADHVDRVSERRRGTEGSKA